MTKIYSYVLRYDDGAAPNPFGETCTLTICKPDIRLSADEGDWVIGTGSKNSRLKDGYTYDLSDSIVYAMKVTKKMSLSDYNTFCQQNLKKKIPKWVSNNFQSRVGDCIYKFLNGTPTPIARISVHNNSSIPENKKRELYKRDLRGEYSLLSGHFYYFGEQPRPIPQELKHIIKQGRKHKVIKDSATIKAFEKWISQYNRNFIYADPQLKYWFASEKQIAKCASGHLED